LRSCLQIAKALVLFMQPVMPSKMQSAWRQLGMPGDVADMQFLEASVPMSEGAPLGKPEILFSRLEDAAVRELDGIFQERIKRAAAGGRAQARKAEIPYEHFEALDIRIGEIKEASSVKGSNKLLKLMVDIGGETRQVVAGIAGSYQPEKLVGTQVVVLVNLKPARLFGIESQAMLLAADAAGAAVLLRPDAPVETGAKVR